MIMMMVMMNCFCGMVDLRKALSLIFSWGHCQRSLSSRISDTPQAGFELVQNLTSSLVEWSCAVVITTTPWRHWVIEICFIEISELLKSDLSKLQDKAAAKTASWTGKCKERKSHIITKLFKEGKLNLHVSFYKVLLPMIEWYVMYFQREEL